MSAFPVWAAEPAAAEAGSNAEMTTSIENEDTGSAIEDEGESSVDDADEEDAAEAVDEPDRGADSDVYDADQTKDQAEDNMASEEDKAPEDDTASETEIIEEIEEIQEEPQPKLAKRAAKSRSRSSDETKKTITITKTWLNDDDSVRPNDLTINLKRSYSDVKPGPDVKNDIISLAVNVANVTAVVQASVSDYQAAVAGGKTILDESTAGKPLYMWYDGGTINLYTEAENVYLNATCQRMFSKFSSLTDISAMSMFNTTYVTNMAGMFEDCTSLVDLSPVADWDTGNVTSMRLMFGANVTSDDQPHMDYTSIAALANWNTQKVDDMGMMFKGAGSLTSVDPISGWNTSNVRNMQQMFLRAYALTDASSLSAWDAARVGGTYINVLSGSTTTGNFTQILGRIAAVETGNLPYFANRPGTWNLTNGTYNPQSTTPASGDAPTTTKVRDANSYDSTDPNCTVTKNGNVWTYEFEVSNDGTIWYTWEDTTDGTHVDGRGSAGTDMYEIRGSGGSESDAVTGVTDNASITNSNVKRKEITVTKNWDDDSDAIGRRPVQLTDVNLKLNLNGSVVKYSNADTTKWSRSGNTWTYNFVDYSSADIDNYSISEDAVTYYSNNGPVSVTATGAAGADLQTGTADITNTLIKHELTIAKQVTGNQADKTKAFEFTIRVYDYDDNTNMDLSGVTGMTPLGNGEYFFSLKDGESKTVTGIPHGYSYQVTESDYSSDGYTTTVDGSSGHSASGKMTADTGHTFENNKSGVLPTGIFSDSEYLLMMLFAALFGILIIIVFAIRKRRATDYYDY